MLIGYARISTDDQGLPVAVEQKLRLGWSDDTENLVGPVSVHRIIPTGVPGYGFEVSGRTAQASSRAVGKHLSSSHFPARPV